MQPPIAHDNQIYEALPAAQIFYIKFKTPIKYVNLQSWAELRGETLYIGPG